MTQHEKFAKYLEADNIKHEKSLRSYSAAISEIDIRSGVIVEYTILQNDGTPIYTMDFNENDGSLSSVGIKGV